MKVFKYFLIILAIGIVGLLVAAGLAPNDYTVERSVSIAASNQAIFPYLTDLKKMQDWSPWAERDPNMEVNYEGKLGEVGSKSSWSGNDQVGSGSQEITKVTDNLIETKLVFIEPWPGEAKAYFKTEKGEGNTTNVTWGLTGENNFMGKLMGLFMNMDEMIGADYEKGLASLKTMVESNPTGNVVDGFTIESITFAPKNYLIKRETVKWEKMKDFFGKHFGALFGGLGKAGKEPAGAPSAIYYKWDTENQQADMAAAAPVADATASIEGYDPLAVEESKALKIAYYGAYEGSEKAHYALDKYMQDNNIELNELVIEEYVTDPGSEPDTTKWLTNIYYLVK